MEIEFEDCSMTYLQPKANPVREIVGHFERPIKEAVKEPEALIVDEAYALQYAEIKQDIKTLEKNAKIMNEALKAKRMPGEKSIQMGKALVLFNEVPAQTSFDYEAAFKAINGDPSDEDKRKYTKTKAGYTTCEVKIL